MSPTNISCLDDYSWTMGPKDLALSHMTRRLGKLLLKEGGVEDTTLMSAPTLFLDSDRLLSLVPWDVPQEQTENRY